MQKQNMRKLKKLGLYLIIGGFLSSCATDTSYHNQRHVKRVDQKTLPLINKRIHEESKKLFTQHDVLHERLTDVNPVFNEPKPVEPEFNPLDAVNISINVEDGDIKQVLRALSLQAGMSLLLDPELAEFKRKISMHLEDVPASFVFDRLMTLVDLSGKIQNNVLIVSPYEEKVYTLDFIQSSGSLSFDMGGNVFGANSSVGGGGASAITGNLNYSGQGAESNDPYEELTKMLESIVGSPADANASSAPVTAVSTQATPTVQPTTAQILAGAVPPTAPPQAAQEAGEYISKATYSLNEMTGVLYVKASPSKINTVTKLIDLYKSVLNKQVLIEAQILDVQLSDSYQYGVDWSSLRNSIATVSGAGSVAIDGITKTMGGAYNPANRTLVIPGQTLGSAANSTFKAAYSNGTFTAALDMLQDFGTVRVLSNPSIRAKNARPAFLSVGQSSQVVTEMTQTTDADTNAVSTEVTTSAVFNGLTLGVEPFIDEKNNINLSIHPMQSQVDKNSLGLISLGNGSSVTLPIVDFKGLTTSLTLKDGDTVILGGLIDEQAANGGSGLPGINEVPLFGDVLGSRNQSKTSRELVLVLRVTLL